MDDRIAPRERARRPVVHLGRLAVYGDLGVPIGEVDTEAVRMPMAEFDASRRDVHVENPHERILERELVRIGCNFHWIERVVLCPRTHESRKHEPGCCCDYNESFSSHNPVSFSGEYLARYDCKLMSSTLGGIGRQNLLRSLVAILTLSVFSTTPATGATPPCLSFEPAVESIAGRLVRKTFAGPPNYESIKAGDEAETGWYVALAQPVCFTGTPGDEANGKDVAGIKLVQLVLMHGEYKTHAALVGKDVKVTGTFFTWQTGHHHTPVLLEVMTLERAK